MRRIVEGYPNKREKMLFFLDLAPPTLQNSIIFHDSTRPDLHFALFTAEIAAIRRLFIGLRVHYQYLGLTGGLA